MNEVSTIKDNNPGPLHNYPANVRFWRRVQPVNATPLVVYRQAFQSPRSSLGFGSGAVRSCSDTPARIASIGRVFPRVPRRARRGTSQGINPAKLLWLLPRARARDRAGGVLCECRRQECVSTFPKLPETCVSSPPKLETRRGVPGARWVGYCSQLSQICPTKKKGQRNSRAGPCIKWWRIRDSNPGPTDYDSAALTS